MPSEIVHVDSVSVLRSDTWILKDATWTVREGEQWVILGPNGSGKTSLLNTLTAFLQPTSGTVRVCGETFGTTEWAKLRERIGIINHTVGDWIEDRETALEMVIGGIYSQINYWGDYREEDIRAAEAMLDQLNLGYAAERNWSQLSQGERQRALIGRALMADFRLLILDEPCAGLDPVARAEFLRHVHELALQGLPGRDIPALVLVTHHVEEITDAFTHVLVLRGGKVHAAGPRDEVLTDEILSGAFGATLHLERIEGSYRLSIL